MVIKVDKSKKKKVSVKSKDKKKSKPNEKLTSLEIRFRQGIAAKQKAIDDAKKAKEDAEKEAIRMQKLITPYLDKLYAQLREKKLLSFWVLAGKSGFKKDNRFTGSIDKLNKLFTSNVNKYKNQDFTLFHIALYHRKEDGIVDRRWLVINMVIYETTDKAIIDTDRFVSCTYKWDDEAFKITKFSFALLDRIMRATAQRKYRCPSIYGVPLKMVIENFEKQGIDFSDVLKPLAGANK
jgi:hypothetical protein